MNELQIFSYQGTNVRTVQCNGEPWWVLVDVCKVLGLKNSRIVASRLDDDEVRKFDLRGLAGETYIVNESGLYSVILRSDKTEARKFKRWITHEVLPSIRKHGAYMTPSKIEEFIADPDLLMGLCIALKNERTAHDETAAKLEDAAIQLSESKEWFTVKRVASLNRVIWTEISWRVLKQTSDLMDYEIKKVFDVNYSTVNAYHINVWKQVYPELAYE